VLHADITSCPIKSKITTQKFKTGPTKSKVLPKTSKSHLHVLSRALLFYLFHRFRLYIRDRQIAHRKLMRGGHHASWKGRPSPPAASTPWWSSACACSIANFQILTTFRSLPFIPPSLYASLRSLLPGRLSGYACGKKFVWHSCAFHIPYG
jgi:hypothetical protein